MESDLPETLQDHGRRVAEIPLSEIRPNINQPRSQFDDEHIVELASSIKEKGILQPLLVRRRRDYYELIAGERRFRAATSLEMESVPCLVVDVSDETSFEMALIENIQREDLNAIEEAKAYQSLMSQFHLNQEEVADRVGKRRPTVANSLRLLNLPLDIQEDVLENRLSAGHARAILSVKEAARQRNIRNMILAKGLSVREAEVLARKANKEDKPKPPRPVETDVQMKSLQEAFTMKMGLPVLIKAVTTTSGKVEIQYNSLDDFEIISDFFGVEQ
jgi:ParB family chromosome partitioning protein